ncbi:excalibur calcium-binding domain-containing protein [Streptomyces poriticola]|uniref:excalibur calcium-binding domain-containing protein n=1 Tax=Streptomyces poriticola TaxID=3120506 RepID=UPI002FCDFB4F
MHMLRKPVTVAVTALALAALPATTAQAHEGNHPFKNCTEAYENGVSNIPASDEEHYGKHLDRDNDGVGCDNPPADFVPAEDADNADDSDDSGSGQDAGSDSGTGAGDTTEAAGQKDTDLAATGGSDATPYIAAGSVAVLVAGGGLLMASRRRRGDG